MVRELEVMESIQSQKTLDEKAKDLQPLDAEGKKMSEHKRFTFDIVDIPSDPLR